MNGGGGEVPWTSTHQASEDFQRKDQLQTC